MPDPEFPAARDPLSLDALKERCQQAVEFWVDKGNAWLAPRGAQLAMPELRFDLRGLVAGLAVVPGRRAGRRCIRINGELLERYPDEMLDETVPHEVAHLISHACCGKLDHGTEWREVMAWFGKSATRCHNMPATPARRQRRHDYLCGCQTHRVGPQINARIRKGQVYHCRSCRQPLRAVSA